MKRERDLSLGLERMQAETNTQSNYELSARMQGNALSLSQQSKRPKIDDTLLNRAFKSASQAGGKKKSKTSKKRKTRNRKLSSRKSKIYQTLGFYYTFIISLIISCFHSTPKLDSFLLPSFEFTHFQLQFQILRFSFL